MGDGGSPQPPLPVPGLFRYRGIRAALPGAAPEEAGIPADRKRIFSQSRSPGNIAYQRKIALPKDRPVPAELCPEHRLLSGIQGSIPDLTHHRHAPTGDRSRGYVVMKLKLTYRQRLVLITSLACGIFLAIMGFFIS